MTPNAVVAYVYGCEAAMVTFMTSNIVPKQVWVPTAIGKTWDGRIRTCSWMIPHQEGIPKGAYMEYVVSMKEIEKKAGIRLLGAREERLAREADALAFVGLE